MPPDDARNAVAGVLRGREPDQHRARGFRLAQDAHGDFGDDPEQALRPGDDAEQVVASGVKVLAADADDLAGHQNQLAAEHVVGGQPVLQAVHAAGILRDVAPDRAGNLRGGIGRIVEAGVLDRLGDRKVGDPRLGNHDPVVVIDFADAVELAQAQEDTVGERQRPAGERRSGPARHDPDALVMAVAQNARDLLGGVGQNHHHRHLPVSGKPVRLVGLHLALVGDDALAGHDRAQRSDDGVAPLEHGPVSLGHFEARHLPSVRPACSGPAEHRRSGPRARASSVGRPGLRRVGRTGLQAPALTPALQPSIRNQASAAVRPNRDDRQ
jgi:hypothetical protein